MPGHPAAAATSIISHRFSPHTRMTRTTVAAAAGGSTLRRPRCGHSPRSRRRARPRSRTTRRRRSSMARGRVGRRRLRATGGGEGRHCLRGCLLSCPSGSRTRSSCGMRRSQSRRQDSIRVAGGLRRPRVTTEEEEGAAAAVGGETGVGRCRRRRQPTRSRRTCSSSTAPRTSSRGPAVA